MKIKKSTWYLLSGMLGCILMGASDWLMIYGDTAYEGGLAWLTQGAALVPPGRNTLAMALAFPAVIFYAIALLGLRTFLVAHPHQRRYSLLTVLGLTPWLCLHLLYTMILFLFGWMHTAGEAQLAFEACEALFSHFSWVVLAGEALMLLPFLYWFWAFLTGKSRFPKLLCLNNPLLLYILLKLLTLLLPDTPFRLAFTNGLMSEAMLLWFGVFLFCKR